MLGTQVTKLFVVTPNIFSIIIAVFLHYIQKCVSVYMYQTVTVRGLQVTSELWVLKYWNLLHVTLLTPRI